MINENKQKRVCEQSLLVTNLHCTLVYLTWRAFATTQTCDSDSFLFLFYSSRPGLATTVEYSINAPLSCLDDDDDDDDPVCPSQHAAALS